MSTRADEVFALIDAVTLGAMSSRIRDPRVFEAARREWGARLDEMTDRQFALVLSGIRTKARGVPTLADVIAMSRSTFEGVL